MKIQIVGSGVVGVATGKGFARFGHDVTFVDIDPEVKRKLQGFKFQTTHDLKADLYFICVPEKAVAEVVESLLHANIIVIRSSVPPGTTDALSRNYSNRPIWHNPEFLREATAEDDWLYEEYTLIGSPDVYINAGREGCPELEELYASIGREVVRCRAAESELAKLLLNSHLASLISFWNEAQRLADAAGVNSHRVAKLVTLDKRISKYGALKHGAPYGGRCLPKDLEQLLDFGLEHGVDATLLSEVKNVNERLKEQA